MTDYIKMKVCTTCLSPSITDINCICTYSNNYPTIELEFKHCSCCGHTSEYYADTEFNNSQLENIK